jgi:hypothetical protein
MPSQLECVQTSFSEARADAATQQQQYWGHSFKANAAVESSSWQTERFTQQVVTTSGEQGSAEVVHDVLSEGLNGSWNVVRQ